ncbi:MAG TPA: M67 family metallopeptidase [Vicinamibacterales bacterium]
MRVRIAVIDRVVDHARRLAPHECCGVLIGDDEDILDAVPAKNIAERPAVRFLIDPKDHLAALRDARRRGLDVVGFYHSHPRSAAIPSDTDRAEATYPHHLFLIVSLKDATPDLQLYWLLDGNFLPTPFVTVA